MFLAMLVETKNIFYAITLKQLNSFNYIATFIVALVQR